MAEMDKVNVKFNADVTKFTRAVDRMERKMREFDETFRYDEHIGF